MSRRRYISTDISTDAQLAMLAQHGPLPLLLYTWAIPHMDDWGRMTGDALQFKLLVCPALNVTVDEVEQVLEQIASAGLWLRYEVDERYYLAIPPEKWYRYQTYINKAKRSADCGSAFPPPPNNEEQRTSPQNAEERRRPAQKAVSPSPSPSPSPTTPPYPPFMAEQHSTQDNAGGDGGGCGGDGCDENGLTPELYWQTRTGLQIGGVQCEELQAFREDGFTDEAIREAMDIALDGGKKRLSYVFGILKRWRAEGLFTVEVIRQAEGKSRKWARAPNDDVPEYARIQYYFPPKEGDSA